MKYQFKSLEALIFSGNTALDKLFKIITDLLRHIATLGVKF